MLPFCMYRQIFYFWWIINLFIRNHRTINITVHLQQDALLCKDWIKTYLTFITAQTPATLQFLLLHHIYFSPLFSIHWSYRDTDNVCVHARACMFRDYLERNSVVIGLPCSPESLPSFERCHSLCQGVEERWTGQRSEREERLKMRGWKEEGWQSFRLFFRTRHFQQGAWLHWGQSDPGPTYWKSGQARPAHWSNPIWSLKHTAGARHHGTEL